MKGVRWWKIVGILFLLLIVQMPGFSRHIIGGEMTYTCEGGGTYHFVLTIYRDCRPQSMAADLDPEAFIGVYTGSGNSWISLGRPAPKLSSEELVDPPEYPCLTLPPNLCVQKGVYEFDYTVSNWPTNQSIVVVYQRCCRNNTISNLQNPDQWGATFYVEITPESQALCNSSPTFKNFPPTVLCADNPFSFDHSAIDKEGDSIVYRFSTPLHGGGQAGLGQAGSQALQESCEGPQPNPACPPPFRKVQFNSLYNESNPMGGNPLVQINRFSGMITGTPDRKGQYVITVLAEEFRDGIKIGEIRRDFQFNLGDCDPEIFAGIAHEAKLGPKEYVLRACGENDVLFLNESFPESKIRTYDWEFDLNNGQKGTSGERNATISFPGIGEYQGSMIINKGLDCSDTAFINIGVYPDINADFTYDYDTCVAGDVFFADDSYTGSGRFTSFEWDFGDQNDGVGRQTSHLFSEPGNFGVTLRVEDINQCVDSVTRPIRYFPVPPLIIIQPSTFVGCQPASIFFDNLSTPIDNTYDIEWNFGDGGSGEEISPTYVYEDVGLYSVGVSITSPIGCNITEQFPDLITVRPSPVAEYTFNPEELDQLNSQAQFFENTFNAVDFYWEFEGLGSSLETNPIIDFPDTGKYDVRLIAIHENGCRDTMTQTVDVVPIAIMHMPNAFTPNGDERNDIFIGKGLTAGMQSYSLTIWNRWGEMIFESEDPELGWNGRKFNSGDVLPNGVYVYKVEYVGPRGEMERLEGFATLIR